MFKLQKLVSNGCHDLLKIISNINITVIISAKELNYHCIIIDNSKSDAINLLQKSMLHDERDRNIKQINFENRAHNYYF